MAHSTGTRRIKQILRRLHLRIYLVHIINNFANLWYWFHESLTEYLYTLFCCPFLWNFLFDFVFIILIITLSILVLAIFRAQTEISTDKSGFLTLTTVVRATGLGALASDKLYNCLWSWWKIFHDWYPLSIFILPSIAFWWGQHRVCYMIVVPNKKLVVRSQYGLMESSLCGRQPLRLSLIFLKEGPSEGFDSFDVCLWLVHPTNQLFHSTACAVIWNERQCCLEPSRASRAV